MMRSMREVTPIRLSEEERQEAKRKQEAYNLPSLSEAYRFAMRRLRMPKKPS
jgi:Arc/MetJ family transcription regulator